MFVWYTVGPLFDLFRKGSENKPRIKSVDDLVGFENLKPKDAAELEQLISAEAAFREELTEAEGDTEYFVHPDNKFWSILVAGNTTRVKWGKIGEDAVLSEKTHADEAAAEKFKAKMIHEKSVKGKYVRSKPGDPPPKPASPPPEAASEPEVATEKAKPKAKAKRKGKGEEEPKEEPEKKAKKVDPPPSPASSSTSENVYTWCVEYAKSGRSTCKATNMPIPQGAVRIGKEVDNPFRPGTRMFVWYTVGPLFDLFRKGSENKPRIKSVDDLVGFENLKPKDAAELEQLISAEAAFREELTEAEGDTEYFVHPDNKFWSILVAGNTTRVKWGKIGEDAVLSEKTHADEAAAEKFKAKMIHEKTVKGKYVKQ